MSRIDFTNPNEVRRLQERARHVATKRGHSELADDFAQEIFVQWLAGHGGHQTIDQAFIDYLRSLYGRTGPRGSGSGSGSGRFSEYRNYVNLDEVRNLAEPARDIQPTWDFTHLFRGRQAFLYGAYFVEEMSENSIADILGLTESRVSQMIKPMKREIQDAALLTDVRERMEWDEDYGKVEVEWITL